MSVSLSELIQQRMAEDELPELLTLKDLVEDYGVEPPEENALPAAAWDIGPALAGTCQSNRLLHHIHRHRWLRQIMRTTVIRERQMATLM